MIRLRLPQQESRRRDQPYRQETDPTFRHRIHILRLADRDRMQEAFADHVRHVGKV